MILPTGTVTFLFTDIAGSTRLWETFPEKMASALARHDALMREAIETHDGTIFKTIGDAFCAAFHTAPDAVAAALASQQALNSETWPDAVTIAVRMALHTGVAEVRDNDYFGQPLNRVARLLGVGHGGQVLLSLATQELVRDTLPDGAFLRALGLHRLKDLVRPENVYQLCCHTLNDTFPPLRSLNNPDLPNNLPQQATSFIGRVKEVADIKGLLKRTRLLTLTGSGGSGKTRLSLQVAVDLLDDQEDGVWFVELASLADPDLVPQTVANLLGVKEIPGEPVLKTLANSLKAKRLLLVLDNCEHVLTACAHLVDTLLKACPQVLVFASSREPLNISGESTYRVPPLSLPDPKSPQTVASVSQYEAVRLFLERAEAIKPGFTITSANAPALAQLCYRLDGIPLAIELAAARVRVLSVEEIAARLDQRFRLLTGGSRTALPRQQTLRALIDWSYDLLTEAEKALLRGVSVFSGGWTVEAAEVVCANSLIEEWEVLDLLLALAEKSLVIAEEQEGVTRYRLLETVRQYARDRLWENGLSAAEEVREKHLDYYVQMTEEAEPKLFGAEQREWLIRLETEHDNLRAALRFGIDSKDAGTKTENALRLCWTAGWLWHYRGYWNEGREWCAEALTLSAPGQEARQSRVYCQAGRFALYQGDFVAAQTLLEKSLALAELLRDTSTVSITLNTLGNLAFDQGQYTVARERYEACLNLQHERGEKNITANLLANLGGVAAAQGDLVAARAYQERALILHRQKNDVISIALSLENLGSIASEEADYDRARTLLEESVRLNREMGNKPDIAYSLRALGFVVREQGDIAGACVLFRESLILGNEVGAKGLIPLILENLAGILTPRGESIQAAQLLGASTMLREKWNIPREPWAETEYQKQVVTVRATLEEPTYNATFAIGQALSLEEAMQLALSISEPTRFTK